MLFLVDKWSRYNRCCSKHRCDWLCRSKILRESCQWPIQRFLCNILGLRAKYENMYGEAA